MRVIMTICATGFGSRSSTIFFVTVGSAAVFGTTSPARQSGRKDETGTNTSPIPVPTPVHSAPADMVISAGSRR